MCLADKAMLVVLNISQWTGRRKDLGATETIETAYSTETDVGHYWKKLLPNCTELKSIQAVSQRIRKYYYEQTLPWFSDGSRIINSAHYLEFSNEFRKLKGEFDDAVNQFINTYPNLVSLAQTKLGALFNAAEYPSAESLKLAFSCSIHFMPVPDVKDFRVDLTESEKEEFQNKIKEVETQAVKECYTRLAQVVNKAVSRLSNSETIIRDSLIENIQDICQLLPKLNVMKDQSLEATRLEVENIVSNINPSLVRENEAARQDSARQLRDALNKMSGFMGAL